MKKAAQAIDLSFLDLGFSFLSNKKIQLHLAISFYDFSKQAPKSPPE